MNKRLKKLTALLLSIVMVFSMVTEAFPAAFADGEGVSTPVSGPNMDFSSQKTRRPGLYVDFLGDNKNYQAPTGDGTNANERDGVLPGASSVLNGLTAPGRINQSKVTNGKSDDNLNGTANTWEGYKQNEVYTQGGGSIYDGGTIFWVGVGIDRMNALDLFKEQKGIYSTELGFYYDSTFIEPYTGPDGNFKAVIQAANLTNYQNYQWDGYSIVDAQTDLIPHTDPVTQEVIQNPDMDEILGNDLAEGETNPWRMTYVSIEKTNVDGDNRFNEIQYNDDEEQDLDTKYLLIIPFKLKAHDPNYKTRVCLRLARSAGLLSIGGGQGGDSPYAAWERVTVRNPGHELKLMTNFRGDLNIFDGDRYLEEPYKADLIIEKAGGTGNRAELSITNDPSPSPVTADTNGQSIGGLYGGTGMTLKVHVDTGYTVKVKVYYSNDDSIIITPDESWLNDNDGVYSFIMPENNVTVEVKFEVTNAKEFRLYLDEVEQDESWQPVTGPTGIQGNSTVLTATYIETDNSVVPPTTTTTETIVDKDSPTTNSLGLPAELVHYTAEITADIRLHGDYEAVVRVENMADSGNIAMEALPTGATQEANNVVILSESGTLKVTGGMPASDVIFHVTYRPATKYDVLLSVYHEPEKIWSENNVAQLATTVYTKENQAQDAYSGVVYQDNKGTPEDGTDDDHSALKDPFRMLGWVDRSSADGSQSLGGDGRAPKSWNSDQDSIMAKVYAAYASSLSMDDFQVFLKGKVSPLDLRGVTVVAGTTPAEDKIGLRKNAKGEFYTDTDLSAFTDNNIRPFYEKLYKLLQLVETAGTYKQDVVGADGTTVLYSYYDLTPAQVQVYMLEYDAYEQYVADQAQYDADKAQYDINKAAYEQYQEALQAATTAGQKYEGPVVREPKEPTAPDVVAPPVLRDDASASAELNNYTWYEPSATTDPPTIINSATLQIRGGRKMAVVLEAESTYTVVSNIRIIDKSGLGRPDIVLQTPQDRSPDYQNVYLFDMPAYNCEVRVTYTERKAYDLKLEVTGDYTDTVAGNSVVVSGYGPNDPGNITAKGVTLTKDGEVEKILEGSTVTVKVYRDSEYSVSASVDYVDENGQSYSVITNPNSTTNMSDGQIFTFVMPEGNGTIHITYTSNKDPHTATIVTDHYDSNTDSRNTGFWQGTNATLKTAYEGETLIADINVAAGYYICAVETYTKEGSLVATSPVILSGNGWNNGTGGKVTATTTMPDEDYFVRVVFRPGPPESEPDMILSLRVNDPDNTDTAAPADNWAKVNAPVTLGPAGLGATGGGVIIAKDYVKAGDTVKLEIHVASGYFVELAEIQPTNLGATVVWTSRTVNAGGEVVLTAEFTMPAASATAVVNFRKETDDLKADKLFLHLAKTEMPDGQSSLDNDITAFISPTIRPTLPSGYAVGLLPTTVPNDALSIGAALPGETVELSVKVAAGWYIHSLTVTSEGGRLGTEEQLGYTLTGNGGGDDNGYNNGSGGDVTAAFVMPDTDARVVVHYRKGVPSELRTDYEVELVVADPDNTGAPFADNWAQAWTSDDNQTQKLGLGASGAVDTDGVTKLLRDLIYAKVGDVVTIENSPAAGHALDIIIVTPSGLKIVPTYLADGRKAQFTMPDSDVTVLVRFKKGTPNRYTADLVLHFPDHFPDNTPVMVGDYDSIGEGSFRIPGSFGLDEAAKLYSLLASPGDVLDLDLLAKDGYYIRTVDVAPDVLGVAAQYTGAFGRQSGSVVMPAANIRINVYFEAGWPDDTKDDPTTVDYDLTLKVYDASGKGGTASLESMAGTPLSAPESDPVGNGESRTVKAYDDDRVTVKLSPAAGCYVQSITITDSRGQDVPWQYAPVDNAGGIAFEMVPAHVTVTVKYAELPDPDGPDQDLYQDYTVRLHVSGNGGADAVDLTDGTNHAQSDGASFTVKVPPYGKLLTLDVTPDTGRHVVAVYAVEDGTGKQLLLPMTQVPDGGSAAFAMPNHDVDVYVVFAADDDPDHPRPDPDRHDLTGTLIVAGPVGSGSAHMDGTIGADPGVTVTTGPVFASGAGSLYAPQGTPLTVDLDVADGYGIAAIRVTDGRGNPVAYAWTNGNQRQFTLTMPATDGIRVYVELEQVNPRPDPGDEPDPDSQLTAQVVVNNGGDSRNKAVLRYGPRNDDGTIPAGTMTGALLTPVYAGDGIYVDITVQTGYQIEYVKVTPVKYGIDPTLYDLPVNTQTTSFLMPGEDVVVYVKFSGDNRERRNVKLVAKGLEDDNNPIQNQAWIHSDYSGRKGPVHPVHAPNQETVQAAPADNLLPAEWVTVDYSWAEGYSIKSLTVKDGPGNNVPFTQIVNDQDNRKGKITFPMVDASVEVTIEWGERKDLPKYDAVLHVIDLDTNTEITGHSWGQLTWLNPPADDTDPHQTTQVTALPTPGGTETLQVPAGETVQVNAHTVNAGVYIQAAFVLYRAGGQMIRFNFDPNLAGVGFSGAKEDTFVMHPGRNDVYIYYTTTPPDSTDYSAVLMLDSPDDDKTSTATIERTRAGETTASAADSVTANDTVKTHGYVTAHDGDAITVTVTPADGYSIESILMTPLGLSSDQGGPVIIRRVGSTYTFTMPAENVAVRIKLKKGSDKEYNATLHYKRVTYQDDGTPVITDVDITKDWASMEYTFSGATVHWDKDGSTETVPEGIPVTLGASITGTDYVLAAYVLKNNGDMVSMTPTLEGLTETQAASPDYTLLDGTAVFRMPAADVDAYVWFTDKEPTEKWHTAVLTVTDTDPNGTDNSGLNEADIRSSKNNTTATVVKSLGVPGHAFLWVEEEETVTVTIHDPAPGYSFVNPATMTHSDSTVTDTLNETNTTPYTYTYKVGDYNSAVVARFEASAITRNPLNVVLIDVDNPGDGTTTNTVEVSPMSIAPLTVHSITSAGGRQRIPSVQSGTKVDYTVTAADGYSFLVRLKNNSGAVIQTWAVDRATGSFSMPNHTATLEIIFYKKDSSHSAQLSVVNADGGKDADTASASIGQMAESAFGLAPVEADTTGNTGSYASLPNGTMLTSMVTQQAAGTKLVQVLALTGTGATPVSATNVAVGDEYRYKLAGDDVEIRMIMDALDSQRYVASVGAVDPPAGAPQIHVTPVPNATEGAGWTVAEPGNKVTVTATVPYGYKAVIRSDDVTLDGTPPIEIDGPANSGDTAVGGTATFTMPAHNVHVTVTYERTLFDATIQAEGTGTGEASLTDRRTPSTSVSVDNRTTDPDADILHDRTKDEVLDYTATPDTGSRIDAVFRTEVGSGRMDLLTYAGDGTDAVTMPKDDLKLDVIFAGEDEPRRYKAFVTVEGDTDGLPENAAQSIVDTTQDLGGGSLWAYGDKDDEMRVSFTTAPDYWAQVTAVHADGTNTSVPVLQQGITGACTARFFMPSDTDVKVTITYHRSEVDPPTEPHTLQFRLVGHGGEDGNYATLLVGDQSLTLRGSMDPTGADVRGTMPNTVNFGTDMYVDATRLSNYMIERITVASGGLETILWKNDYGYTSMANLTMPNADALVTVYYRLPYTAQLAVVDKWGVDYDRDVAADTAISGNGRAPKVTLTVTEGATTKGTTTFTHTKIDGLYGTEKVTATVDMDTMPADTEVASVIATTASGTFHLTETAPGSGVYEYMMSEGATATRQARLADDVTITVILRDNKIDTLYTATVYRQGHDNKPGNKVNLIKNDTTAALRDGAVPPNPMPGDGKNWTGAYEEDVVKLEVTTAPTYYAIITATYAADPSQAVSVLQWTIQGDDTDPIKSQLAMPAHDVDITVTYTTEKPENKTLTLALEKHVNNEDNEGALHEMANSTTPPDLTATPAPTPALSAQPDNTSPDPLKETTTSVDPGTYLWTQAEYGDGYYIKSITMKAAGFTFDLLDVADAEKYITRMPFNDATVTITYAPGKQSGRPYDPEHSERYNGVGVWTDASDPNDVKGGDYKTGDTTDGNLNPDLSVAPLAGQQGWILAEKADPEELTVVVTVPTLYDKNEDKGDAATAVTALADAGVDPGYVPDPEATSPKPPTYKFYWWDKDNSKYEELKQSTDGGVTGDILITNADKKSLTYADNPKGDFPKDSTGTALAQHYGYQLTLKALGDPDAADPAPLIKYIRAGGEIYVTATRPDNVPEDDGSDSGIPWVESEKTQVIIEPSEAYTATLHIVDTSSSLNNKVEMSVKDDTSYTPVTTDGGKIEKLHGKETLQTEVTRGDPDVKVVSVLAIPKKGSPTYLSPDDVDSYPYEMPRDDVDIVVVLANEDDALYTATVVKVGPDNVEGNTVAISNQTHPVLNRDTSDPMRWTLGYAGDEIRVDATAAPGYRAVVTAKRMDTDAPLAVTPAAGAGTMVITLDDKMPAANVEITVTFEKVEEANQSWVTLRMRMDSVDGPLPIDSGNKAEGSVSGTATLTANAVNSYTDTQLLVGVSALDILATPASGYGVQGWYVNGALQSALGTNANATISIPASGITNTVITVVLKETEVEGRTPRPFDPAHSAHYPNAMGHTGPEGHQDGYLLAENQGNSLVEITVPNLYDDGLHAAKDVVYTLYAKVGGAMVKLIEGTDYDTVIPVAAVDYTHTATGTDEWTGQVFTIKSLDPTSVLGDYVKNGGVIYITATKAGETESGYTEVVIPADPNTDGYKATLKVIDDTDGATTNHVKMQNANNSTAPTATVPWDTGDDLYPNPAHPDPDGRISGLFGGEIIRTEVTPDSGVTYTVMAHTQSMGDVLLFPDPTDTDRYRKDMPTEDMDIIVHFRAKGEHIHIAAVEKRGATGVLAPDPGNDAKIYNQTDLDDGTQDLKTGTIWAEGRCAETSDDTPKGDTIRVDVTTAEGYYATVTMSYYDPADGHLEEKTLVVLGSSSFDTTSGTPVPVPLSVTFEMPDADVQVVVLFEAGNRSPRPYDPKHSETYYGDAYQHYTDATKTTRTPENQSTTDQEGWLLGENLGGGRAVVTIPTLWSEKEEKAEELENATNASFTFYLGEKDVNGDYTGNYIPLVEGVDYTLAHYNPDYTGTDVFTVVTEDYRYIPGNTTAEDSYDGVKFMLVEKAGGRLDGLLDSGLSLFVSATKLEVATPSWVEGETTELVIPSTGLRPFDPDNEDNPNYEDHWITSENRGDYLIVTVPMLNSPNEDDPTEVDGDIHRFQLHLQVDGADRDSAIVNVTQLLKITNIKGYDNFWNVNTEYDPTWTGDVAPTYLYEGTYENEIYNDTYLRPDPTGWEEGKEKWHGARFIVEIMTDEEIKALGLDAADETAALGNAKILRDIFDNQGTMNMGGEEPKPHRMYITSDEVTAVTDPLPDFRAMDYVDFEVPRYYSLTGELISWAPTHIAELTLYRQDGTGYEPTPWLILRSGLCESMIDPGDFDPAIYNDRWSMDFAFKSSKLANPTAVLNYQMVVTKTSHITYIRRSIELDTTYTAPLYDSVDLTFSFQEPVALFAGDIAPLLPGPNQIINGQDRDLLAGFVYDLYLWTTETNPTAAGWEDSVFNPDSCAYAADLDGNGKITEADMAVLMSDYNFHRRTRDYGEPAGLSCPGALITMLILEEAEAVAEATDQTAEEDPTEDPEEIPDPFETPEFEPEESPDPAEAPEPGPEEDFDQPDLEPDPDENLDSTEAQEPASGEVLDQPDPDPEPEPEDIPDPTDPPEPIEPEEVDPQEPDSDRLTENEGKLPADDKDKGPDENVANDLAPTPNDNFTEPSEG